MHGRSRNSRPSYPRPPIALAHTNITASSRGLALLDGGRKSSLPYDLGTADRFSTAALSRTDARLADRLSSFDETQAARARGPILALRCGWYTLFQEEGQALSDRSVLGRSESHAISVTTAHASKKLERQPRSKRHTAHSPRAAELSRSRKHAAASADILDKNKRGSDGSLQLQNTCIRSTLRRRSERQHKDQVERCLNFKLIRPFSKACKAYVVAV